MPLLASQVKVVRDARFRSRWPNQTIFVQLDELIRTRGEGCPRVAAIWDQLLGRAKGDTETWDWFSKTFPGVPMVAGGNSYPRPADGSTIPMAMPRVATPVQRAIETIKSFRRN